ncbi:HNH endonuclease [bacterium]|nr:HNH endonuclease [bacterium]
MYCDDDDDGYYSIDDEMMCRFPFAKEEHRPALRLKLEEEREVSLRAKEKRERAAADSLDATSESTEPAAKRHKKGPSRVEFYATEGVPEFGTVVSGPAGYGEWRTVPGFSADKLRVSKTGFYQVCSRGRWLNPDRGSERRMKDGTMRHMVGVDKNSYYVYHFVLRAFKGPRPPGTTGEHDDRNTSNNHADNLEWETWSGQAKNQRTDKKVKANGKPMRIRHKDWPIERDWEAFETGHRAAKAYGLDPGSVRSTAKGLLTHTGGFLVEFLPPKESQEPLGVGDDSNLDAPPLDPPPADKLGAGPSMAVEEWRLAPGVTNLRMSTRGRVQTKEARGNGWSYKRTPVATAGQVYAYVKYKGRDVVVHRLVWMTFVGSIPKGMTIDHMISSRKLDNRLSALRLATRSEQNLNQDWKPISKRSNSQKTAVRGRPVDGGDDTWEEFESQNAAERELHARFPGRKFDCSHIGESARAASEGKKRKAYGWEFEFV